MSDRNCVIRSHKRQKEMGDTKPWFWRRAAMGYTDDLELAGIFDRAEAERLVAAGTPGGNEILDLREAQDLVK